MKARIGLLLTVLTVVACADLAAPPELARDDQPTAAAARAGSAGVAALPTFGGTSSQAEAINDAGIVVGYANEAAARDVFGPAYAAKWVRDPLDGRWQVTRLGVVRTGDGQTINPAPGGRALGLNELGDAVGTRDGIALVWPASGGEVTLPNGAVAEGINAARIIVGGTAWNTTSAAVVWTPDLANASGWSSRVLPSLAGGTLAHAFAINERGDIAGTAASASGRWQAVVWQRLPDGAYSAPIPLSGTEASLGNSGGFGINGGGDVVGYYSSCNGCSINAYFWPAGGGTAIDLALLNSSTSSGHARGTEDGRRVVGFISTPRGSGAGPFLWAPGSSRLTDLGTGEANDINNSTARYGQEVVGFNRTSKGTQATVWRVQ